MRHWRHWSHGFISWYFHKKDSRTSFQEKGVGEKKKINQRHTCSQIIILANISASTPSEVLVPGFEERHLLKAKEKNTAIF